MKDHEIELDANDLISAVEDIRDHVVGHKKLTLRQTEVDLPEPAPL